MSFIPQTPTQQQPKPKRSFSDAMRIASEKRGAALDEEVDESVVEGAPEPPAPPEAPRPGQEPASAPASAPASQPPVQEQPPVVPEVAPAPIQGAAESPPANAAPPDPWAEYQEVEYEDADTGEKFVVRAPKQYAERVRGGYLRRSDYNRKGAGLKHHRQWIEPLIEQGSLDSIAPLIQDASRDPELANTLAQIWNRRRMGMPMLEAQTPQAQAAPTPQNAQDDILARLKSDQDLDDYTRGVLERYLTPFHQRYTTLQSSYDQQQQRLQQEQQRLDQQNQQQRQLNDAATLAQTELAARYPEEINARTPVVELQRIGDYARNGGYLQRFGVTPAAFVLAYQDYRSAYGAPGLGMPAANGNGRMPNSTAATLADAKALGQALANQAAAQVASSAAPASTPAPASPANEPRKRPSRMVSDGKGGQRPRSPKEVGEWLARNGQG